MRIQSFRIENFRNLRLAACAHVPDFMVLCGGNGSGKSALLDAIMTAKECVGAYVGNFRFDRRAVSAEAEKATIEMTLAFTKQECIFMKDMYKLDCPESQKIVVEFYRDGRTTTNPEILQAVRQLFGYYSSASSSISESPGFFEYINAYRQTQKVQLQQLDLGSLSDARIKETLALSDNKFQLTKQYLIGCQFKDLHEFKASSYSGQKIYKDSLGEIKELFNSFFAPMKFEDITIKGSTFEFIISTPHGNIDIDDLSSGEKEILNIFIRFHQLKPKGAIILFDEADAHLHPDLERRYLYALKKLCKGNQLLLTTHSPEMMIAAGTEALYTVLKEQQEGDGNQLERVTQSEQMHRVLSDLMGSRGIISFNQHIIFIEGEDASSDREIYEAAYPPAKYNISFVPAGNSSTVRKTAEQVNALLTTSIGFQQYFSIIDKDIERLELDPTSGKRLFRLPVYHVENLLLDADKIFEVTHSFMLSKCPYKNAKEVDDDLRKLVLSETHLNAYAKALRDARVAKIAKEAYDGVYRGIDQQTLTIPKFSDILQEARQVLQDALERNTWRAECKGRDLLKAYCSQEKIRQSFKYEQLRNLLIARIETPPREIEGIMSQILNS